VLPVVLLLLPPPPPPPSQELDSPTPGLAPGFVQANMVAIQKEHAYDFLMFCLRNPQPCPLLDVSNPGEPHATLAGPGADLRSCIPRYKVWRDGACEREASSVEDVYAEAGDMVTFLLGCSFSWESKLTQVTPISPSPCFPLFHLLFWQSSLTGSERPRGWVRWGSPRDTSSRAATSPCTAPTSRTLAPGHSEARSSSACGRTRCRPCQHCSESQGTTPAPTVRRCTGAGACVRTGRGYGARMDNRTADELN
jgi:hypothetical protein